MSPHKAVSENRKIRKPIMEKKRRARINDSLETLKKILLESDPASSKKNGQRTAKLEKADILEMTVKYLQYLKNTSNFIKMENCPRKVNEDIEISPADSSTGESATKVHFGATGTASGGLINFPNSVANRNAYGTLYGVSLVPTSYNSGGVVYMVPPFCSPRQLQYFRQAPQPSAGDAENVWRPW